MFGKDKTLEELEAENELMQQRVNLAEKQALINEAKKKYGKDWKLHIPNVKSGMDWSALKFRVRGS